MLVFETAANERLAQQNGRRHGIFSRKVNTVLLGFQRGEVLEKNINKSADNTPARSNVMRC